MVLQDSDQNTPLREDGFGVRRIVDDPRLGLVERLELAPALSSWASEQAIRARASHLASVYADAFGRVLRIERSGEALAIVSAIPDGIPLSDVLAALEFKTVTLSGEELLALARSVVDAVAAIHDRLGPRAHGALTPAHIVIQRDASTILTGAVFAEALHSLERNREALWREFGLALPSSASLPRLDQRGDVTQLGAVVLAIAVRRTLRRDEYPRGVIDVVSEVERSWMAAGRPAAARPGRLLLGRRCGRGIPRDRAVRPRRSDDLGAANGAASVMRRSQGRSAGASSRELTRAQTPPPVQSERGGSRAVSRSSSYSHYCGARRRGALRRRQH
jgi:hypothetical protein